MTRPPLIASVNLSREDRWADTPYQFLHTFAKKRVKQGYTHIQLGRPLHKSHPAWGRVWEPLNAHEYITRAQRIALEEIVKAFPDVTFSVHLGFEWITPRLMFRAHFQRDSLIAGHKLPRVSVDRYSRVAGRWKNPQYHEAVFESWDWWEGRGYQIFSEGINVQGAGGIEAAENYALLASKPIATIPQMTRRGVITSDQPNSCMTHAGWLQKKFNRGEMKGLPMPTAPFYLAVDQASHEYGAIDNPTNSDMFSLLRDHPNVGILILNGGRRDQTEHGDLYAWGAAEFGGG